MEGRRYRLSVNEWFTLTCLYLVFSLTSSVARQCHCAEGVECDAQTKCEGSCAEGWDGPFCQRQNAALGQKTNQSSTYCEGPTCFGPENGVDGKTGHDIFNTPCTHTLGETTQTWTVYLKEMYTIYRFSIFNRANADCGDKQCGARLNRFSLSVDNQTCYQDTTSSEFGPGYTITEKCNASGPVRGDSVTISAPGGFSLCEVLLYVCSDGWYDEMCDKQCETTTACAGCDPFGIRCQACVSGLWGEHCQNTCGECFNNNPCDKDSANCLQGEHPRCAAGYVGLNCTTSCALGKHGPDCEGTCGSCVGGNATCNITSGNCPDMPGQARCMPGFFGQKCDSPCQDGRWGADCPNTCGNCYGDASCDKHDGECSRCAPGYMGTKCETLCPDGTWGDNCSMTCSGNCKGENCSQLNGVCETGCTAGFMGNRCDTVLQAVNDPKTNSPVGWIVGSIVGSVALGVVVAVVLIRYRRRLRGSSKDDEVPNVVNGRTQGMPRRDNDGCDVDHVHADGAAYGNLLENSEPETTAVSRQGFRDYLWRKKAAGDLKAEFESFLVGLHEKHDVADLPQNKAKSRYKNLVAYDHSRVVLTTVEGASDYINACYINGYKEPKKFIASQGPTDVIIDDFMLMLWEQNVGKVVMVTNLVEYTKKKSNQYWPNEGSVCFGVIEVTLLDEALYANYVVRTLQLVNLKVQTQGRLLKQFHFTAWPDHGVPPDTTSLLDFRDTVLEYTSPLTGPIVVHCSAGIGRTGTFIALDYLIDQDKTEGMVDVPACVRGLRQQRVNMVQTQKQYEFLHEALEEALELGGYSVRPENFPSVYPDLCGADGKTGKPRMAKQFEVLGELTPPLDKGNQKAAHLPENLAKNRSTAVLALDTHRPYLSTQVKGCNDYINAVFLPGYRMNRGFILTQTPLPNTVVDFWRLVYEENVNTVVSLDLLDSSDKEIGVFWPELNASLDPFEVLATEHDNYADFSATMYELTYDNEGAPRFVRHVQCKFWPGKPSLNTIPSLMAVLRGITTWQEHAGSSPVLVHCRDGVTKSGLFCVASFLVERLKAGQNINIPQTVKQMRTYRPEIIVNRDQFDFLHRVVLGYLENFQTYANFS